MAHSEAKVKKALIEGLGPHSKTVDKPIIDYLVGILSDYSANDGETLKDTVGPLLSDSIPSEQELDQVCDRISNLLFNREGSVKREEPLKRLAAPVTLGDSAPQDKEAEMSLFIYQPSITRGARARGEIGRKGNAFVDRSDEARLKREKKEAAQKKKDQMRKQRELENARRDPPVISPQRRRTAAAHTVRDLHLEKFDIALASKPLIQDASLSLLFGRRYGFVGRNGAGKTTLLRAIAGRELNGIPEYLQILHVEQEAVGSETTVLQSVLEADLEREQLLAEERQLMEAIKKGEPGAEVRLTQVIQQLQEIEADKAEARASAILAGLGFSPVAQKRPTKEFSGGWRMRTALARALFCQPDLLLLDEPTNMLDIGAVIWLENYLRTWKTTLFVVSHDRNFLNAVATDIVHLNQMKIECYRGDYDTFEKTRVERLKNLQKSRESQEKMRQHTQRFIDRFRYNAKRASLVQSRIKMLKKMEEIPALLEDPTCSFSFPDPDDLPPPLIQFDNVTFAYPGRSGLSAQQSAPKNLFENVTFGLDMDSRIALVGANGQGKTTLLKLITGELQANSGFIFIHRRLRFATFSQHHVDQLDMDLSALQFFMQNWPVKDPQEYGISGDLALQPISTLSGGQKSRVVFAMMGWIKPHFLVLDEPTNHLDVETVDILSRALNEFAGGIVLVSHDERLITSVCNDLWIVHEGKVTPYAGDFDDYKKTIISEFRA